MIKIYKVYDIEDIDASLRESILAWYTFDKEWGDKAHDKDYDLSTPIGRGRTAVAHKLISPVEREYNGWVLKQFFPTKDKMRYAFLDDNNYKLKNSNDRKEFEELLNGFIMTAKTSRHLKKAYEGEEATLLVNQSLAMTSIGVCLLSEIKGIPLDERLSGKSFNDNKNWTKENLLRVLIDINKILNNDITIYHEFCEDERIHLDVKSENFLFVNIDLDKTTNTIRSLDLGSVRTIKELIAQKDVTLFESSPQTNSFELIGETVQQIKICNENEATLLLKQLDLLAVVKMMLIAVFGEDIFEKEREQGTAEEIVRRISHCLHQNVAKASFATLHVSWLFQKLVLTVNRLENCKVCEQIQHESLDECNALTDKAIEEKDNSLLNPNNILTLSKLKDYISTIIEILENEEGCYKLNHANYKSFDYLLENNNITTMSGLLDLAEKQFGTYAVPPCKLIEHLAYSQN